MDYMQGRYDQPNKKSPFLKGLAGAVIGAAGAGLGMKGVGSLMQKSNPQIGKMLSTAGGGALSSFQPNKSINSINKMMAASSILGEQKSGLEGLQRFAAGIPEGITYTSKRKVPFTFGLLKHKHQVSIADLFRDVKSMKRSPAELAKEVATDVVLGLRGSLKIPFGLGRTVIRGNKIVQEGKPAAKKIVNEILSNYGKRKIKDKKALTGFIGGVKLPGSLFNPKKLNNQIVNLIGGGIGATSGLVSGLSKGYSFKRREGLSPIDAVVRGAGTIGGLTAATIGGTIGASSASSYNKIDSRYQHRDGVPMYNAYQ